MYQATLARNKRLIAQNSSTTAGQVDMQSVKQSRFIILNLNFEIQQTII